MGIYKYLSKLWKNPRRDNPEYKNHLIEWRKQGSIIRAIKPTRLARARALGYKAKQGVVIVRVRIKKGGRKRRQVHSGRKPSKSGIIHFSTGKNFQTISETRAHRSYPNLRVLNSYEVGDDGKHKWYEIIMLDVGNPQIFNDKHFAPICTNKHRGRAERGLTSSGKKGRGLRNKGVGAEKIRPSIKSKGRLGK